MLRLYVLQNLYTLSDEGTVSEVIDSRAFSDFCGVDSGNQVPDGDTLGRFRSSRSKAQVKRREREKSSVRAKVEHIFTVVKGKFRYRKTRYRGLLKQTAKLNMVFALANLILADRPSLAA